MMVTFWTRTLETKGIPERLLAPVGGFKHREILSRISAPLNIPCADVASELRFGFDIALGRSGPAARNVRVDIVLDMWRRTLREEIVPKFARFFTPQRR